MAPIWTTLTHSFPTDLLSAHAPLQSGGVRIDSGDVTGMWRRRVALAVAGMAWGAAGSEAMPGLPYWMSQPALLFTLSAAICATTYLTFVCHQRPILQAYELGDRHGYERGRRDAILEVNRIGVVTPIHSARRSRRAASRTLQQV